MKQTKHILVTIAILLCSLVTSAQTKVEIDGIWYNLVSKAKQAEVTYKGSSYNEYSNEYSGSIAIPTTVIYEGVSYSVTSIGNYAFSGCSLTSITIPESVTSIGDYAFCNCSGLTAITIPESVTSIGDHTFSACSSLTSITLPESVTSIGYDAFYGCSSLTSITIPESVTSIGSGAFEYCSRLTSITLPESVTSIGSSAFRDCSSLTSITLPESVTSIGGSAFYNCSSLTSITLPESVTSIGSCAFYGCRSLTAITLPESVTSIGYDAFYGCSSLTSITIPENSQLTSIGSFAFDNCGITSITLPESVTSIGNYAFSGCRSLTSIVLPEKLKSVGSKAFANCTELLDVYCYAESVPSASSDAFDGSYPEYITLHVLSNALESYKTTSPWSSFGTIVALGAPITDITLSQSSATLYEGESLALVAVVTPDNATDKTVTWSSSDESVATVNTEGQVTAIAVGNATITATANDGSGVSASCEVEVKEKLLGKCATPVVNYVDGKVVLTCSTEEVEYVTSVVPDNELNYQVHEFDFIPTYTFNVYATKTKYENSDVVSVTICWIDCAEEHASDDDTGILAIPSQPVLIQSANGVITLTGLAEGTAVEIYNLNGMAQGSSTAVNGTAAITTSLEAGSTAIVKIGKRSVKVILR